MHDCFIVFGASVKRDGKPSATMESRVTVTLGKINMATSYLIIPTGGVVTHPPEESVVMQQLFLNAGIPKEYIYPELKSTDTFSSVVNCIDLLQKNFKVQNVYICTSSYHVPRCMIIFWLFGMHTKVGGVAGKPPEMPVYKYVYIALKEVLAIIKDCAKALYFRLKLIYFTVLHKSGS